MPFWKNMDAILSAKLLKKSIKAGALKLDELTGSDE